ncbi:MAG: hypothetical protein U0790_22835 [Isosphaeraceae bacterium]
MDTLRNLKDIIDSSSSDPVKHIVLYNMGGTNKYLNWNTALLRSQPRP